MSFSNTQLLKFVLLFAVLCQSVLVSVACSKKCSACEPAGPTYTIAKAVFKNPLKGVIVFTQKDEKTLVITGKLTGLPNNSTHGFHVHTLGDLSNGCASALAHYNPFNKSHGGPNDTERHVGDFGNIIADQNGEALVNIEDSVATLNGQYSIVGRTLMVHEKIDDLGRGNSTDSHTTGNAGARIDCAIIGVAAN